MWVSQAVNVPNFGIREIVQRREYKSKKKYS